MNLREFADPPKKCRPIPYWSLNNELEPAELESQVRDFKKRGFGGFVMHAAEGLKTAYLSDDWMKALKRAVETAAEIKIEAWFHDEDRGPSGSVGGEVAADNEAFLPRALVWAPLDGENADIDGEIIAYTATSGDGAVVLSPEQPADTAGAGVFILRTYGYGHNHFNGDQYADLLNPAAVRAFLDSTHEKYAKSFTIEVGEFLPGMVTDGATVNRSINRIEGDDHRPVSFPWTPEFPAHFHRMHGYSILDNLHHLVSGAPGGFAVRHDYWRAVNDLFIEVFTYQLSSWCSNNGMMFAGTVSAPGDFRSMLLGGGPVMPHYEHMSMPAVESPGTGVETAIAVKEAASAAAQFGKQRLLAKVFGGLGYGRSFGELKTVIDRHIALGATALSPQQASYSLAGDRKYDSPPTCSYHHPAAQEMRALNDYAARCAWIARRGHDTASVLVMMPATGAYGSFDNTTGTGGGRFAAVESSYRAAVNELIAEHVPFHIGDERITSRYGRVDNGTLRIGNGTYGAVILPPSPSWRNPVVELLESFDGRIVIMGDIPGLVDGRESDRIRKLAERSTVTVIPDDPARAAEIALPAAERLLTITGPDGLAVSGIITLHRIESGAHIIFLANTDASAPVEVTVSVHALGGVVELDAATGRGFRYRSTIDGGATNIDTTLAPAGSRIFLVDQTQTSLDIPLIAETESPLTIKGPYRYHPETDNCLVLDHCSLDIDRRPVLKNTHIMTVKDAIWEKTALAEYRGIQPWMLKARNVRSRTNATRLTYTFTVRDIPGSISLAMEHSDRFTVTINGTAIDFGPGRWFLDRRTRVLKLAEHVVAGENTIVVETDYLWDTEITPLYIFGDFAVGSEEEGFPIISRPTELPAGSWTDHGFPFYTGTMTYLLDFTIEKTDGERYEIDLAEFRGAAVSVRVNDTPVGILPFPPYRGDITGALANGSNVLEIAVAGTLRNLIGPLHGTQNNDSPVTPASFADDGSGYRFAPHGLVAPPRLIRITPTSAG